MSLSSTINPIVAEEIRVTSEPCYQHQRTFIHQFNNFYIGKICIYLAAFAEIFV